MIAFLHEIDLWKWAVDIFLAIVVVWALLSYASAPNTVALEHSRRMTAESRVVAQSTEIAYLQAKLPQATCPSSIAGCH